MTLIQKPDGHPVHDTIRISLAHFKQVMGSEVTPSDEQGVAAQVEILGALKVLFRQQDQEVFNEGVKIFEGWIGENIKGVMSPQARFRYLHKAKEIAPQDHNALTFIINMLCRCNDKRDRAQVINRIDMGRLDKFWIDGGHADKLRNYFFS